MAEIDPVILELMVKNGKFRSDLRGDAALTERELNRMGASAQRVEKQMLKSSTAISHSFRNLAATLGTYFTGRELTGMIDSFTRLQNNLRVAGLEGEALAGVQRDLLDLSSRYGTSVEGLSEVFLKASLAQGELGASSSQIVQLNEVVAASLKITGTSAQQAQGALQQLGQALGSGVVRAEEFNSVLEGALPLAQAAARGIDGMGGSVSRLREAVANGEITSRQFFEGVLKGGVQTIKDAENATLTLAGAFEALSSRLTVYVGESAKANGVTQALAGAMMLLAKNIETIIPILATIAVGLGVGVVTNAVRARIALLATAGAATTATVAFTRLAAVLGGPVGIAITATIVGFGYLAAKTDEAANSAKEAELQSIRTASAQETEKRATELLAQAKGAERAAQIAATKASRDRAAQALQTAKALQAEAKASLVAARAQARKIFENSAGDTGFFATFGRVLGGAGGAGPAITPGTAKANRIDSIVSAAQAKLDDSERKIAALEGEVEGLSAAIGEGASAPKLASTGGSKATSGKRTSSGLGQASSGSSGPSADEINDRFNRELISIAQQTLSARMAMATSAEERADLEATGVELARRDALNSLEAEKEYSAAQKERIKDALDNLADMELERIEREKRLDIFRDDNDIAEARNRVAMDALRDQYDLAQTDDDRRRIALQIFDAEEAFLRSKLAAVAANDDLVDAVREQARIELAGLNASAGDRRKLVEEANQGALGRYIDDIGDTKARVEEATVRQLQEVNDGITDAITSQLGIKNDFVKDLFSIFLNDVIFKPLAQSLKGGQAGGFFGTAVNFLGSIFGRSSGGYVAPGQTVRVNEHAGGAEYLRMGSQGGTVIPLGQVNQSVSQQNAQPAIARVQLMLSDDIDGRIASVSGPVAVEIVRASAPGMVQAAVSETTRRLSRPKMG